MRDKGDMRDARARDVRGLRGFCLKSLLTLMTLLTLTAANAQGLQPRRSFGSRFPRPNAAASQPQPQPSTSTSGSVAAESGGRSIEFNAAPVDMVFTVYQDLIGKTVLKDPQTPAATITLQPKKGQELSDQDKIEAIETVLEMNGIHIEPYGDGEKFVRALPRKDARKEGIPMYMSADDLDADCKSGKIPDGKVVSLLVKFDNIATEEAQKALEGFKSNSGILLVFERTNSILITDTKQNIDRMREIAKAIDIASPVMEEVKYFQIKYANANEIKQVIDSIVQESQKEQEKNGKAPANQSAAPAVRPPLGGLLNRNRQQQQQPQAPANQESLVMSVSDADRGMIRGKVVTIADERSNKILIITSASNMKFFEEVINALDVETTPDTVVKVYRLKYAEAEDVSDMINDLIGNSASGKDSKGNQNQAAKSGTSGSVTRGTTQTKKPANQRTGDAKAGELNKENTTVLADKRINGLVVMTQKDLVPTLEQIIEAMDVKLDQVLIETVIIEVGLNDTFKTGIDWVKGMKVQDGRYRQAIGGGGGSATAIAGSGGGSSGGGSSSGEGGTAAAVAEPIEGKALIDGVDKVLPSIFSPGSGLTYALFSEKFDLGAVISASKSDNNSKYLASPIVMTLDNKEATINCTKMKYLLKGFTSSGNSYSTIAVPDYEQKELGIEIKITPKINPTGTVMLTVEEKYTQVGDDQTIKYSTGTGGDGGLKDVAVPTTITREMSADVLLENAQTVVFGGLTETQTREGDSGIPFLKDIPVVGKYLFGQTSYAEDRSELLVFMTPYVLKEGDEAEAEAMRRKNTLSDARPWQDNGWSKSKLADPIPAKEQFRRQKEEWKKLDEEHKVGLEIEKSKKDRVRELKRRARKESEQRRKDAEREAEEAKEEAEEDAEERSKVIEAEVKAFNANEDERARQRAQADLEARENNPLLRKLHQENGIGAVK